MARFTSRAFVLATLAGVAVLLFSGTALAETCETGCEDASDTASPHLLGSTLSAVNGLAEQPMSQLLGQGDGAAETTFSDTAAPAPATETAPAAAPEDTTPELAQQATNMASTTVTDTVEAVVPVADTVATPARDLLEAQPLQDAVDTTTDATAELVEAAVPVVAATVQTLDATTQQLLDTAQATTTAVLGSAQQVVATATSTLQPVTVSVTGALATAVGGPALAQSAPSAAQAAPGSGVKPLGDATPRDTPPIIGIAFPGAPTDLAAHAASDDCQVPTQPPDQTSADASAADGDESALVLTGQHATPVPVASGASAANGGGTTSPSPTELGKVFFDLIPAARQLGFVPALHHSAHVPAAPVVEPAQSPD